MIQSTLDSTFTYNRIVMYIQWFTKVYDALPYNSKLLYLYEGF